MVEAAQADSARFLDLYDRHFHRVYAYALRRTGNRAAAEDISSEVFHRALASLKKYQWRGTPFVAWLFRIAANELADHWQNTVRARATRPWMWTKLIRNWSAGRSCFNWWSASLTISAESSSCDTARR
jgi:DNA-directed RNA polymerase specialized sigma24 family protein